jgi:hypothetical protein
MRLRARLARERDVPPQPFIFRFVMSTPGIAVAALLVLVVGTVVFIGERRPQSPSLATGNNNAITPSSAPAPAVATNDQPPDTPATTPVDENQNKPKQSPLVVRNPPRVVAPGNSLPQVYDLDTRRAPAVRAADRDGEVSVVTPLKPMVVTMYDEHGVTKKIQLPPVSFGSQRLTDSRVPVSMTNAKDW